MREGGLENQAKEMRVKTRERREREISADESHTRRWPRDRYLIYSHCMCMCVHESEEDKGKQGKPPIRIDQWVFLNYKIVSCYLPWGMCTYCLLFYLYEKKD